MQYAYISAYFFAAVLIPLAFIVMLWGLFYVTGQRNQKVFWSGLIAILAMLPVLTDVRTPRGEFVNGVLKDVWIPPGYLQFLASWGSKGLTYLVLAFSLIVIVKNLHGKHDNKRHGGWLYVSYLFLIVPSFISGIAGTRTHFTHFMIYAPLIFTLAYLVSTSTDWKWYAKQFKLVLLIYVSLSALLGILAPTWAVGSALILIPGFDFRLHGIFSHSNGLGMAALIYLVLDWADDSHASLYRILGWIVSFAVLIATQSKTSWIGAALALVVFLIYKITVTNRNKHEHSAVPAIMAGLLLTTTIAGLIAAGASVESWFKGLDSQTYSSLTSLTGRTRIWEITIRSWLDNPIFGYGPGLWDREYRLQYAPQYLYIVGMAHNQFFQTLGESGVLGVIGLVVYVVTLIVYGLKFFTLTRGASLALVIVLIARSISETPFRNQALDLMFFVHFAIFVLFLSLTANAEKQVSMARPGVFERRE